VTPRRLVPLLAAALLLSPRSALADDAQSSAPPPGPFKLGPLYLTPRLELRNAGSDSNVYNAPANAVSDASFVVAPGLELALPTGRRFVWRARGVLTYSWYEDEDSERSTDRNLGLSGDADFGRLQLRADVGWGQAKQRYSLDLDERLLHHDDHVGLGARLELVRHLDLAASWRGSRFDIEGPPEVQASLDHDSESFTGELTYEITPRTSLLARAERIEDTFDEALGSAGRSVRSGRYLGGFSFSTRAAIDGQLLFGLREFPGEPGSAAPPYTGPALDASLGIPAGRLGQIRLRMERDVQYSATPGEVEGESVRNSFVFSRYEVQLQTELPYDFIARGLVQRQGGTYQVPYVVDGVVVDRDARLWIYGVSLLKAFGDSFRIGGGYTWEQRESTLPGDDYRSSRYGIQAEYAP
jgi:hypothetical protein